MLADVAALGPEVALLAGALVVLLGGSFTPRRKQWRTRVLAVAAVVTAAVLAALDLGGAPRQAFESSFVVDDVTGVSRLVVCGALLLVLAVASDEVAAQARESEFYTLLLLGGTGALTMVGTTDLALLVVAFLLSSIPVYGLVGMLLADGAAEAALKTYLVAALMGILLMLGAVLLTGMTGVTHYGALGPALADAPPSAVAAGGFLVLAGLLFKAGAVPAHFWVPDAAQGASASAAAFVTTVPKVGGVVALTRLLGFLPDPTRWAILVAVLAAVSMTLGNLAAYGQDDPRRLLGWSTVSQVGYLLVPVAVTGRTDLATPALLFYLAGYAVTNVGAFAAAAAAPDRRTLGAWTGLGSRRPGLALALAVLLLGLVGTPPTAVFVGKLAAAAAAWDGGLAWLAVVLLVNTLASLFYYLRWVAPTFRIAPAEGATEAADEDADGDAAAEPSPDTVRWPAAAAYTAAVGSLVLGLSAGAVWPLLGL